MSLLCRTRSIRCKWNLHTINQSTYRASYQPIYSNDSSRRNFHCAVISLQQSIQLSNQFASESRSQVVNTVDVDDISNLTSEVGSNNSDVKRNSSRMRRTKRKPEVTAIELTEDLVTRMPLLWSAFVCPQSASQSPRQSVTAFLEYVQIWHRWYDRVRSLRNVASLPSHVRLQLGNVLVSVLRIPSQLIVDQESNNTQSNLNNQPISIPSEQDIFDLLVNWRLGTDSTAHDLIIRQYLLSATDLSAACQRLDSLYEMNLGRAHNSIQVEMDLINCMLLTELTKHNQHFKTASIEQSKDSAFARLSSMAVRVFDSSLIRIPSVPYSWIIALVQCSMHDIQSIHHIIDGLSNLSIRSGRKQLYKAVAPILDGLRSRLKTLHHSNDQSVEQSIYESDLTRLDQAVEKLRTFCKLSVQQSQLFHLPNRNDSVQTLFTYDHPSVRLIKSILARQSVDPTNVNSDVSHIKSNHPEIVDAVALLQLYCDVATRESWYAVIEACQSKNAFGYLNDIWNAWQSTFPATDSCLSVDSPQNSNINRPITLTEDQISRLPNAALFAQLLKLPNPPLTTHQIVSLLDQWGLPTNVRLHFEMIRTCLQSHVRHDKPQSLRDAAFWYENMFHRGLVAGSQIVSSEFQLVVNLLAYQSSSHHLSNPNILPDPLATAHNIAVKAWEHLELQTMPTTYYMPFMDVFGKYVARLTAQSLNASHIVDLLADSERCIALWQAAQRRVENESMTQPDFKQHVFSLGLHAVRYRLMALQKISESNLSHDLIDSSSVQPEIQALQRYLNKHS